MKKTKKNYLDFSGLQNSVKSFVKNEEYLNSARLIENAINKTKIYNNRDFFHLEKDTHEKYDNFKPLNPSRYEELSISYDFYGIDGKLLYCYFSKEEFNITKIHVKCDFTMIKENYIFSAIKNKLLTNLDEMLNDIDPKKAEKILKNLCIHNQSRLHKSFSRNFRSSFNILLWNDYFKFDFFTTILSLENRFYIRLFKIFKLFTDTNKNSLNHVFTYNCNDKRVEDFDVIYKKYFINAFTFSYFKKNKNLDKDLTNDIIDIGFLINEFDKFESKYFVYIYKIFNINYKRYFDQNTNFFHDTNENIKRKLKIWCYDLFKNKVNMLLLLLVPELKILFNYINISNPINNYYRKFHFLISFFVFKFAVNVPFIKLFVEINNQNQNF